MLVASELLPMPGRPAMMIRSDLCSPPIFEFKLSRPVVIPDKWPPLFNARSAISIASLVASPNDLALPSAPPSSATL